MPIGVIATTVASFAPKIIQWAKTSGALRFVQCIGSSFNVDEAKAWTIELIQSAQDKYEKDGKQSAIDHCNYWIANRTEHLAKAKSPCTIEGHKYVIEAMTRTKNALTGLNEYPVQTISVNPVTGKTKGALKGNTKKSSSNSGGIIALAAAFFLFK